MRTAHEIKKQMDYLQAELDDIEGIAPMDRMSVREFARAAGVSPTTALRMKKRNFSLGVLSKVLPFMNECPCCKQKLPKEN